MKHLLHLAFKGTKYHGWQRQPTVPSVQATLEDALEKMLRQKIPCIGCGRTDAGVHASQFFCHIEWSGEFDFDPVFRLNKMLPNDIVIFKIKPVGDVFHAQHSAYSRTYTYHIHTAKDPFLQSLSSFYSVDNLDFTKMERATALLPRHKDFRAMCKHPDFYESTICQLSEANFQVLEDGKKLRLDITSNRFLRNMVRLLVGNILEVGYGRMSLEAFENHLATGVAPEFFNTAFPQGLYLSGVRYREGDLEV